MAYWRNFKTANERRGLGDPDLKEFEVKVRANRNMANLPDSWDDFPVSAYGDRCWKRHRKSQRKAAA